MVVEVPLTQGLVALVDDEDAEKVQASNWRVVRDEWNVYAKRWGRDAVTGERLDIRMHRLIMNAPDGMLVDHINHNGLDNRRENLRICTLSENQHNRRKQRRGTSRFKGVYWDREHNGWRAQIVSDGRRRYLGNFSVETDAARAYNAAAIKHYGEFAMLNEITEEETA